MMIEADTNGDNQVFLFLKLCSKNIFVTSIVYVSLGGLSGVQSNDFGEMIFGRSDEKII